jgi:hypothetical protein
LSEENEEEEVKIVSRETLYAKNCGKLVSRETI